MSTPRQPAQDRRPANVVPPKGYFRQKPCGSGGSLLLKRNSSRKQCMSRAEDKVINLDAGTALIYVSNAEELLAASRANALTSATDLSAAYRGDDHVEH